MGTIVSFGNALKDLYKEFKKSVEMVQPSKKDLIDKAKIKISQLKDWEVENNNVYKSPVVTPDKLPLGEGFFQPITPLDSPHIYRKIKDFSDGNKNLSSYYQQIENEIKLNITNCKDNLNAIKEDIEKERMEVYKKNNIDVILTMAS